MDCYIAVKDTALNDPDLREITFVSVFRVTDHLLDGKKIVS